MPLDAIAMELAEHDAKRLTVLVEANKAHIATDSG
jgi:hypothetical protein